MFYVFLSYGQRQNVFMAERSATAEGENWAYGPTLHSRQVFLHWAAATLKGLGEIQKL